MNNSSSHTKNSNSARSTSTAVSPRSYRGLIIMAILYAAWLIWLTYVGLVNYQAGNQ